jgi:hypothetical protein
MAVTRHASGLLKWRSMNVCVVIALGLFWCLPTHAANINAVSCSQTDVQTAVDSASTGDTVLVPGPCFVAWSSGVTIPGTKGITVQGGGLTTLTSFGFSLNQSNSATSRITGFTFTDPGAVSGGAHAIRTSGSKTSAPFRIDHNVFISTSSPNIYINTSGNAPGLIDHNTFTASSSPAEMIHNLGLGPSDTSGWTDDVVPGSATMLFIEDNTFTFLATGSPANYFGASAVQSYYGARTVVRHNSLNMVQVDQHGTCGNIYARWWEVYENTFSVIPNGNQSNYVRIRGGSGVVWNNHKTGSLNLGAGSIEFREDCASGSYAIAGQVGRGINQNFSPTYAWNNDASMQVIAGGPGPFVQAGRDFFTSTSQPATLLRQQLAIDTSSTTYNYVPYTYPHPLQGVLSASPAPPTGLTALVQ